MEMRSRAKAAGSRRRTRTRTKGNLFGWLRTKLRSKQIQINRVRHGLITGRIQVQMVAGVVGWQQICQSDRIADDSVEINQRVIDCIRAEPGVNSLARS